MTLGTGSAGAAWVDAFPRLAGLTPTEAAPLLRAAVPLLMPAGATVFSPGQVCTHFILMRHGHVRVFQIGDDGDEIVLYRLGAGDICILTTLVLLGAEPYSAFAVAETPVEAMGVPVGAFNDMMSGSATFRRFVFTSHAERLGDLMRVIQHVAFESIDTRLASRLLALGAGARRITITHQQLAAEIGSAREVVSRHLKAFERRGLVSLGRGEVVLVCPDRLRAASET